MTKQKLHTTNGFRGEFLLMKFWSIIIYTTWAKDHPFTEICTVFALQGHLEVSSGR